MSHHHLEIEENSRWFTKFDSYPAIIISFSIWGSFYILCRSVLKTKSEEYCCRLNSALHGAITALVGINECLQADFPFDHPESPTVSSQKFLMVTSLGYFICDLIWCAYYQPDSKLMLAHHVYSVCALHRMLFKGYSGAQASCALGCMELSNPLLQIRWFLRSEGFYPSALFTSVEITFMIVFLLVRIVLGTYFLKVIVFQPKNDWDFTILSGTIYIMSWMFMINIGKYFMIKYGGLGFKLEDIHNKGT